MAAQYGTNTVAASLGATSFVAMDGVLPVTVSVTTDANRAVTAGAIAAPPQITNNMNYFLSGTFAVPNTNGIL